MTLEEKYQIVLEFIENIAVRFSEYPDFALKLHSELRGDKTQMSYTEVILKARETLEKIK